MVKLRSLRYSQELIDAAELTLTHNDTNIFSTSLVSNDDALYNILLAEGCVLTPMSKDDALEFKQGLMKAGLAVKMDISDIELDSTEIFKFGRNGQIKGGNLSDVSLDGVYIDGLGRIQTVSKLVAGKSYRGEMVIFNPLLHHSKFLKFMRDSSSANYIKDKIVMYDDQGNYITRWIDRDSFRKCNIEVMGNCMYPPPSDKLIEGSKYPLTIGQCVDIFNLFRGYRRGGRAILDITYVNQFSTVKLREPIYPDTLLEFRYNHNGKVFKGFAYYSMVDYIIDTFGPLHSFAGFVINSGQMASNYGFCALRRNINSEDVSEWLNEAVINERDGYGGKIVRSTIIKDIIGGAYSKFPVSTVTNGCYAMGTLSEKFATNTTFDYNVKQGKRWELIAAFVGGFATGSATTGNEE